jgi:hypothetical protein
LNSAVNLVSFETHYAISQNFSTSYIVNDKKKSMTFAQDISTPLRFFSRYVFAIFAEQHHFYAFSLRFPLRIKNVDAAPTAPGPTLLYDKT